MRIFNKNNLPIIHCIWEVFKGKTHVKEDFSRAAVYIFLVNDYDVSPVPVSVSEDGSLHFDLPFGVEGSSLFPCVGCYGLKLIWLKDVKHPVTCFHDMIHHLDDCHKRCMSEVKEFIAFTDSDDGAIQFKGDSVTLKIESSVATYGYDGLSAYELAVMRGLTTMSEVEWLKGYGAEGGQGGGSGCNCGITIDEVAGVLHYKDKAYKLEEYKDKIMVQSIDILDGGTLYADAENKTLKLSVNVLPASATNREVEWSSSDPAVARVDQTGTVTAVSVGTATIRATAKDGSGAYGEYQQQVSVKSIVVSNYGIPTVTLSYDSVLPTTLYVDPATFVVTQKCQRVYSDGTMNETDVDTSNADVRFESLDTSIATVDAKSGKVTFLSANTSTTDAKGVNIKVIATVNGKTNGTIARAEQRKAVIQEYVYYGICDDAPTQESDIVTYGSKALASSTTFSISPTSADKKKCMFVAYKTNTGAKMTSCKDIDNDPVGDLFSKKIVGAYTVEYFKAGSYLNNTYNFIITK